MPYYSINGNYALNVQCIVNDREKFVWAKFNNKGASHDSTCFNNSELYQVLQELRRKFYDEQFYFICDSAYSIEYFLIPPYDLASPNTPQNNFNFFHSNARITAECAFGEIDLRWKIFWKRLGSSVNKNILICKAAMYL